MTKKRSDTAGYVTAAVLGVIGGGILMVFATKAIPAMISRMMHNMMDQMKKQGCDPAEM